MEFTNGKKSRGFRKCGRFTYQSGNQGLFPGSKKVDPKD